MIYGDYDVDGITSISVLQKFLEEREVEVESYIPNRLEEGYGLNKQAIKDIYDKGYRLMITVDCGISAVEEVEYANSLGMTVIITDHHEPLEQLPKALAVIDAKRKDNTYPFNQLAGVGVVLGLKCLLESAGYKKIDSSTISFGIAPRVNACGRMGHETEALDIFLSDDINKVKQLSDKLNEYNKIRQETEKSCN